MSKDGLASSGVRLSGQRHSVTWDSRDSPGEVTKQDPAILSVVNYWPCSRKRGKKTVFSCSFHGSQAGPADPWGQLKRSPQVRRKGSLTFNHPLASIDLCPLVTEWRASYYKRSRGWLINVQEETALDTLPWDQTNWWLVITMVTPFLWVQRWSTWILL